MNPVAVPQDRGATAVEYALMVSLIALVIFVTVTLLGGNLAELFQDPTLNSAIG